MKNKHGNVSFDDELEITVDERNYTVEYAVEADCIYAPAFLSGLPENCHPDESEVDILDCKILCIVDDAGAEIKDERIVKSAEQAIELIRDTDIADKAMQMYMDRDNE